MLVVRGEYIHTGIVKEFIFYTEKNEHISNKLFTSENNKLIFA